MDSVRGQHWRRRHGRADKTEERIVVIEHFFKSSGTIVVEVRRSSRKAAELRDINGTEVRRIARQSLHRDALVLCRTLFNLAMPSPCSQTLLEGLKRYVQNRDE